MMVCLNRRTVEEMNALTESWYGEKIAKPSFHSLVITFYNRHNSVNLDEKGGLYPLFLCTLPFPPEAGIRGVAGTPGLFLVFTLL